MRRFVAAFLLFFSSSPLAVAPQQMSGESVKLGPPNCYFDGKRVSFDIDVPNSPTEWTRFSVTCADWGCDGAMLNVKGGVANLGALGGLTLKTKLDGVAFVEWGIVGGFTVNVKARLVTYKNGERVVDANCGPK